MQGARAAALLACRMDLAASQWDGGRCWRAAELPRQGPLRRRVAHRTATCRLPDSGTTKTVCMAYDGAAALLAHSRADASGSTLDG